MNEAAKAAYCAALGERIDREVCQALGIEVDPTTNAVLYQSPPLLSVYPQLEQGACIITAEEMAWVQAWYAKQDEGDE